MHPLSEDAVVDGSPATGWMEIVLAGGRRVIVDRAVNGSEQASVIAVPERRLSRFRAACGCRLQPV